MYITISVARYHIFYWTQTENSRLQKNYHSYLAIFTKQQMVHGTIDKHVGNSWFTQKDVTRVQSTVFEGLQNLHVYHNKIQWAIK